MKKRYTGFTSRGWHGEIIVEWLCPKCIGPHVKILKDERYRSAKWCDGTLYTRDEIGYWYCEDCKVELRGRAMISEELERKPIEYAYNDNLNDMECKIGREEDQKRIWRELYDENEGVIEK